MAAYCHPKPPRINNLCQTFHPTGEQKRSYNGVIKTRCYITGVTLHVNNCVTPNRISCSRLPPRLRLTQISSCLAEKNKKKIPVWNQWRHQTFSGASSYRAAGEKMTSSKDTSTHIIALIVQFVNWNTSLSSSGLLFSQSRVLFICIYLLNIRSKQQECWRGFRTIYPHDNYSPSKPLKQGFWDLCVT